MNRSRGNKRCGHDDSGQEDRLTYELGAGLELSSKDIESLARKEHERWLAERKVAGYTPQQPRP